MILDDYQDVALGYADWSRLRGVEPWALNHHLPGPDWVRQGGTVADAEILVVMRERTPVTGALLDRLPRLRLVVTSGMRNASIDLDACAARGITVCGTSSSPTPPVELTWALILGLARNLVPEASGLRAGARWQSTVGTDLAGATLGVLGLGKIGTRVAAVGLAFGMRVVAWSPYLTDERAALVGVRRVSKDELFAGSDVLTVHLVLAPATRGIVDAAAIDAMKETALFVNTARAGLVDGAALLAALDDDRIRGAGLDVFDEEPLPFDDRLRTHLRVLATPHLGYVTEGNYRRYFAEAVEDIEAWLSGTPVRLLG